ncbi:gp16 family protein [Marinobacterium litorale]|uniref:gp16 family protein n=1 Tax=Marinobacterium litorale TaxID=404770 RepID=UPI0004270C32|nr:regulatory protein GemA [Marinobacterium litorale]
MSKNPQRNRDLAAIHAARRALALDEDLYRELLEQWTGKRSAADLTARERGKVLNELGKIGFQRKPRQQPGKHPGTPNNLEKEPMLQKVEAQLADMKLPWSYADAIAKQQFGIARVGWLKTTRQFDAVIAALHVEQEKRSLWTAVEREMNRLGLTEADIERDYHPRKGWKRNRKALEQLLSILNVKEA